MTNRRVTAGPYTLELPVNGVAILYEADGAGVDHRLPGGAGYIDALVQFAGETIRLQAMLAQMQIDRRDHALAVRDAISETARTADELAFWRYQAIYHRTLVLDPNALKRIYIEECQVWSEAEKQLEAQRADENRERYSHAEPPRDPGGT